MNTGRVLSPAPGRENRELLASTVLIVDDHSSFRASARRVLERDGYQVVGEAVDGASAIARARELRPRLALVDVYLPDIDGFEVASRLAALDDPPVVVLTSSHDRSDLEPLVPGSGARGFVPKSELSGSALEKFV
jgi:DNA-binding NarL/FixJ family response regulator